MRNAGAANCQNQPNAYSLVKVARLIYLARSHVNYKTHNQTVYKHLGYQQSAGLEFRDYVRILNGDDLAKCIRKPVTANEREQTEPFT